MGSSGQPENDWFRKWVLGIGIPFHQRLLIILALLGVCVLWALLDVVTNNTNKITDTLPRREPRERGAERGDPEQRARSWLWVPDRTPAFAEAASGKRVVEHVTLVTQTSVHPSHIPSAMKLRHLALAGLVIAMLYFTLAALFGARAVGLL